MTQRKHSTRPGVLSALFFAKRTLMQKNDAAATENDAMVRQSRSCKVGEIASQGYVKPDWTFPSI